MAIITKKLTELTQEGRDEELKEKLKYALYLENKISNEVAGEMLHYLFFIINVTIILSIFCNIIFK